MIVFLNNDVETLTPDWLTVLVREAMSPGTGAVGAMLYPDDGCSTRAWCSASTARQDTSIAAPRPNRAASAMRFSAAAQSPP